MLLHINGKFTMGKFKSSLLSLSFVLNCPPLSSSWCRSRYEIYLSVSVVSFISSSIFAYFFIILYLLFQKRVVRTNFDIYVLKRLKIHLYFKIMLRFYAIYNDIIYYSDQVQGMKFPKAKQPTSRST